MNKTLDLSALRSFVAVADIGGVTAAAGKLNLTQSAASMQIKRLETLLGQRLIARQGRGIKLTVHGEQLLDYGRQILGVNDEVWNRMTHDAFEGKLVIRVPPDILSPHIPKILREFCDAFPRVEVKLVSTWTAELKKEFTKGKLDLILTTESKTAKGGERLVSFPLKWFCQRGNNQIWKKRPLPLAYERRCIFRKHATDSLDAENIPCDLAFVTVRCGDCIPYINAGLAVVAVLQGTEPEDWQEILASAGLPKLSEVMICLYITDGPESLLVHHLASIVRDAFLH